MDFPVSLPVEIPDIGLPIPIPGMSPKEEKTAVPEVLPFGNRGMAVRKWREERTKRYEEIMNSTEDDGAPGQQHNFAQNALAKKKAEIERQMKEIADLQAQKAAELKENAAEHAAMCDFCTELLLEIVDGIEERLFLIFLLTFLIMLLDCHRC